MLSTIRSEIAFFTSLLLLALWKFPLWGERMLSLKRNWDSYRAERRGE